MRSSSSFFLKSKIDSVSCISGLNFAARIITGLRKYDHISPALKELGWLSVEQQLHLKDVTMVYKCVNGLVLSYLSQKLSTRAQVHNYHTRTFNNFNLPLCRKGLLNVRSFTGGAIILWK